MKFTDTSGAAACAHIAVVRIRACGAINCGHPDAHGMHTAMRRAHLHVERALTAIAPEEHAITEGYSGICDDGDLSYT